MNITQARKRAKELGISNIKDRSLVSLKLAIENSLNADIDVKLLKKNLSDSAYCDDLMESILDQISIQSGIQKEFLR